MEALKQLWTLLNGKKTSIGAALLIVGAFIGEVMVGIWHIKGVAILQIASTFNWFGMAMGGTGIFHKLIKSEEPETDTTIGSMAKTSQTTTPIKDTPDGGSK